MWNGIRLSNTTTPVYLGIHIDRTLCYKTHIEKTKMKVNARNNIIRKLANSKWGCKAMTLRPSCLALCYSAAENACPVWARSTHAHKLNPALHDCCRIISGAASNQPTWTAYTYWPVSLLYGAPFSHLFTELKISPIEVNISAIQLQISPIHLKISSNQLEISTIKAI